MIGSFGDILNIASNSCVAVISLISGTLSFSFNVSYFIGQLIVKLVVSLVSLLVECISTLQTLIQVLTEDYFVFISDITLNLSHIFKTLLDLGERLFYASVTTCSSFGYGVQSVQSFVILVVTSILNCFEFMFNSIFHGLLLIKNSLILVGLTSWDLFVFFPNKVIAFKKAFIAYLFYCMKNLRDAVNSLRASIHYILMEVALFVSDIPRESLYGLFVCLLFGFIFVKYHRSIQPLLVKNVVYILSQSQKTLFSAWTYLEAFTFWLLTNEMTPSLSGARRTVAVPGNGADMPRDAPQNPDELDTREEAVQNHLAQPERKLPLEPEERLCVVCQDSEKCTIILPCRHVCLCYECCIMVKRTNGRCPICRHIVRRTMRVYI